MTKFEATSVYHAPHRSWLCLQYASAIVTTSCINGPFIVYAWCQDSQVAIIWLHVP